MAVVYTQGVAQFFDNNGDPLSGGKLYTYEAGTTTPKPTYTSQSESVQNANPVILDSAGRAKIWINGSYKYELYSSTDVLIWSEDNITSFNTSASVADNSVTNAKLAQMPANSIKTNPTNAVANAQDLQLSASRILGRGPTGNVVGLQVGSGLTLTDTTLSAAAGGLGTDLANSCVLFDDFHYPASPTNTWAVGTSGTGAQIIMSSTAAGSGTGAQNNTRGFVSLETGSTATGYAAIAKATAATTAGSFFLADGAIDLSFRVKIPTISTGTQRFITRHGMVDAGSAVAPPAVESTISDAIYFRQVDNVNSGNWQCVCMNGGTETAINTSVAGDTNENTFRVVINAAATSVEFFINGVSQGTTTTNIPSGSSKFLTFASHIVKTVGTTTRNVCIDYIYMSTTRT